jgi:hypothetical protein
VPAAIGDEFGGELVASWLFADDSGVEETAANNWKKKRNIKKDSRRKIFKLFMEWIAPFWCSLDHDQEQLKDFFLELFELR